MKRFKKTLHPKLKKKTRGKLLSITGKTTIAFPTNEELRRDFPELIVWTGGSIPTSLYEAFAKRLEEDADAMK